jgi:allantoin racemase
VTTLARSIPVMEHNLVRYGLASRCCSVRAAGVEVLALEDPTSGAIDRISAEIEAAKSMNHAEAIVLGCAGMADLAAHLAEKHGLPVIDGVASAVAIAEALVSIGLSTSKIGGYAPPLRKAYLGAFAAFAP